MPIRLITFLSLFLGLTACASNFNPLNWFSRGTQDNVVLEPDGGWGSSDARALVDQVSELKVLRNPDGAMLQVVGLPPRLGYWDAELVAENDGRPVNGVLTYTFRISEPPVATRAGTPYSRRVFVAQFVPNARLAGVRSIRVVGATNSMTARR
ncbi:MAG TPA: hypothetical protein ENK45_00620 [Aliiroseovarius sp.]|nr:hypothetical protein [Aliiroseovarius sp.]